MTMTLTEHERALVDGSEDEIAALMGAESVVVDWRGDFEEICRDFSRRLPPDALALDEDDDAITVCSQHATAVVPLVGEAPFGLDLAAAIAAILPPRFEARAFRMSLESDTHCYFVRPGAWWDAFRAQHGERYREIFAEPSELPDRFEIISEDD